MANTNKEVALEEDKYDSEHSNSTIMMVLMHIFVLIDHLHKTQISQFYYYQLYQSSLQGEVVLIRGSALHCQLLAIVLYH